MEINILAFGMIAEVTAARAWKEEGIYTTAELRQQLEAKYPSLREMKYLIAVNKQIVAADTALVAGAEVALLPPFSGG